MDGGCCERNRNAALAAAEAGDDPVRVVPTCVVDQRLNDHGLKIKISQKVRANYEVYSAVDHYMSPGGVKITIEDSDVEWLGSGPVPPVVLASKQGVSSLEAFAARDSQGRLVPCREPEVQQRIVLAKAYLNMMITMWARGMAEITTFLWELRADFPWLPEWVWDAVHAQAAKRRKVMKETEHQLGAVNKWRL